MKNKLSILSGLLLITLLSLTVFSPGCGNGGDDDPEDPTVNTITLNIENSNVSPYEIIEIEASDINLNIVEITASINDEELDVYIIDESSFSIMVPNLTAGTHSLVVEGDNSEGNLDISVASLAPIANPTEVISNVTTEFNNIVSDLQTIANEAGTSLDSETETLINNLITEYENAYAQLSDTEKEALAHFIQQNEDLFNSSSKSNTKMTDATYQAYHNELMAMLPYIVVSGASIGVLIATPDPTFFTKAAATIGAIYLIKKFREYGFKLIKLYAVEAIAFASDLYNNDKSNFTFSNNEAKTLNIQTTYRSIYNAETSSPSSIISAIVSSTNTFFSWWDKIDGMITTIKNIFGFSGGSLEGRPDEVSEIESYTTNQIAGESQYASISGITNPNVSPSVNNTTNGLVVTFTTNEEEDQDFDFTYTFSESGYIIEKTYSATLSVGVNANFTGSPTSIIEGESVSFTDLSTGNPTSWSWDFGDGGTSSSQNPTHTYNDPYGYFTVSLTVCNAGGCDTETKSDYILVDTADTKNFFIR